MTNASGDCIILTVLLCLLCLLEGTFEDCLEYFFVGRLGGWALMQKQSVRFLQNVSHNRTSHKTSRMLLASMMQANPAATITSETPVLSLLKII